MAHNSFRLELRLRDAGLGNVQHRFRRRIIARVTVSPIGPGDHYLKVDFNPEGEPDSSGHECLSIYDPIANHEYVLAEYVAGGYYLHATAVNCTYTIVLEQQF